MLCIDSEFQVFFFISVKKNNVSFNTFVQLIKIGWFKRYLLIIVSYYPSNVYRICSDGHSFISDVDFLNCLLFLIRYFFTFIFIEIQLTLDYISFRCTIQWFGICIHCEMTTIVSLANIQHQRVTNFIFLWWEFLNSTLSELLKYAIQYY